MKNAAKNTTHYDVAIVGGGLAGLTQALLLAHDGFRVACIDAERPVTQLDRGYDTRTTAISWGSRNVLRKAGVWDVMEDGKACPILDIRILDGDSSFVLPFLSRDVEGREFGWIVDNFDLRLALHEAAAAATLTHITGAAVTGFVRDDGAVHITLRTGATLSAPLVLGCDGRNSKTRDFMKIGTWGHDYGQIALVCIAQHEAPHNNVAVEHFLPDGPFASLPMTDDADGNHRSAIVWSLHGADARIWLDCDEAAFNERLNGLYVAAAGAAGRPLFGKSRLVGTRAGWPLNIKMAYSYTAPRMALMAEAAHGIHPIAGQGLNLSLRDTAEMTAILTRARTRGETDFGAPHILATYQRRRRLDNTMMGLAMEGFNALFSNDVGPIRAARRAGLRLVARLPRFKRFFMTQAMGTVGHVPDMVKDDLASKG